MFDRPVVEVVGVGCVVFAEQGAAPGFGRVRPVGPAGACRLCDPLHRRARELRLPGPDGRLDQLDQRPNRRTLVVVSLGVAHRGQGRVEAAEPEVQRSSDKFGDGQRESLPARPGIGDRGSDQLRRASAS